MDKHYLIQTNWVGFNAANSYITSYRLNMYRGFLLLETMDHN